MKMKTMTMTRNTSAAALAALLTLTGCQTTSSTSTYDAIKGDVAKSAGHRAAAAPGVDQAVADALLPPASSLATQLPRARPALEERFNVAFNNVPAQQFFRSIVAGTRYNILVHPDVSGTITANLKDVTLQETLEAVREMYGYDYKVEGTRISIKPLTLQTKMFHVNYLVGKRIGGSSTRVSSTSVANSGQNGQGGGGQNNYQNNNFQNQNGANGANGNGGNGQKGQNGGVLASTDVATASTNDFWGDLKAALETIVGTKEAGRSVVISAQSGVVVIRAMPDELRNVDAYLRATQLSVDRQVILEAKILEVQLNDSYQSGVNWASFAGRNTVGIVSPGAGLVPTPSGTRPVTITDPTTGLSASGGFLLSSAATAAGSMFGLAVQGSNFAALLSFLETQGTVHVLSSPRIAAVNNQKAVLKIGTDEFFVTGVTTTTNSTSTGNTVTPSVELQPFFSGVVLDVTPQIDEKGNILLHVHPSVSQVSTVNKSVNLGTAGSLNLPLAASDTSELDSIVRGQNGQVVAIGGLMRQSSTVDDSSLPGTGGLPVLSTLFGAKKRVNQKRELVVLIKPTIIEGANNWNDDLLDTGRRIEQLDPRQRGMQ
jgi:MSHA biogenesis protein MshL